MRHSINRCSAIPFLLAALTLFSAGAYAQFIQQGSKLVGTGAATGTSGAFQGSSVSISGDGNTALVGGWVDSNETGAAWVFSRVNGVWSQQGSKLVGSGAMGPARQAIAVSISSDGNTAILGGVLDSGSTGAAWIFVRSGSVWIQQGEKLVGTGAAGHAEQGCAVGLSSDGTTAIVGGYFDSSHTGAAWIFTRTAGEWSQQGRKLVGSGAVGQALQGVSVSISSDGNTALIGGYADSGDAGAAWVFTRLNGVWSQQGGKLVGTGAVGAARQGMSVALSSDGNTAIVGGNLDDTVTGAAWIFTRTGGLWSQQGKLVGSGAVPGGFGSFEGYAVSISADGNTAIIGGYPDDGFTGAAWVFTRSGGVWTQLGSKIVGTGSAGNSEQGVSVSLSSDGSTALVGGFADSSFIGAAWVFTRAVSSVQETGAAVPVQFSLGQNYPNPFNPSTVIRYEIPRASRVDLAVYDILGRQVSTVVADNKEAGSYEVKFDGSDLASGVYMYRLRAGEYMAVRRFVLVK